MPTMDPATNPTSRIGIIIKSFPDHRNHSFDYLVIFIFIFFQGFQDKFSSYSAKSL